jgi:UDP-N-acetylmuramate: L-alanyl-gamma-D-glutamyl-meso-diaminopimelate ligase
VVILARADLGWDAAPVAAQLGGHASVAGCVDILVEDIVSGLSPGDHVVFMSNGAFDGAALRLVARLAGTS